MALNKPNPYKPDLDFNPATRGYFLFPLWTQTEQQANQKDVFPEYRKP